MTFSQQLRASGRREGRAHRYNSAAAFEGSMRSIKF